MNQEPVYNPTTLMPHLVKGVQVYRKTFYDQNFQMQDDYNYVNEPIVVAVASAVKSLSGHDIFNMADKVAQAKIIATSYSPAAQKMYARFAVGHEAQLAEAAKANNPDFEPNLENPTTLPTKSKEINPLLTVVKKILLNLIIKM